MAQNEKLFFPVSDVKFNDMTEKGYLVNVNETNIALFKHKDEVFGVQDKCPHAGGPLHLGDIETLPDKSICVKCPWHSWRFNLKTGEIVFPKTRKDLSPIISYPIQINNDKISIGFDEIDKKYFNSTQF